MLQRIPVLTFLPRGGGGATGHGPATKHPSSAAVMTPAAASAASVAANLKVRAVSVAANLNDDAIMLSALTHSCADDFSMDIPVGLLEHILSA